MREFLKQGPVILSFYRGDWCGFCNLELKALESVFPEIEEIGASLLAISPQLPPNARALINKYQLRFELLSDLEQKVIKKYQLQFTVPTEMQKIYLEVFKLDLTKHNSDKSWDLPVPATFILDSKGIIRNRYVSMNYMTRMEPDDVIKTLRSF